MLGFAETLGATVASFVLPAFVALLIFSVAAKFVKAKYLAAFAVGVYLWFFSDTIGDANLLGANEGFSGGVFHAALWVAFALGVILVVSLDREVFTPGPDGLKFGFAVPLLVAVAVGIHGFGEGASIGATAVSTPSGNLIDAFGGFSAAVAFILHKGLEPMMVGAAYWVYARGHARDVVGRLKDITILTVVVSLPGIIGGGSAYFVVQAFPNVDFTYVYALGLGTSVYALIRLARPLFEGSAPSRYESTKVAILIVLGLTCLYLAAMLHS